MPRHLFGALAVVAVLGSDAPAQVVLLDEGSFTISENGQSIGREEFRIRSVPRPRAATVIAQATVSYNDHLRVVPALRVYSSGTPLDNDVMIKNRPSNDQRRIATSCLMKIPP